MATLSKQTDCHLSSSLAKKVPRCLHKHSLFPKFFWFSQHCGCGFLLVQSAAAAAAAVRLRDEGEESKAMVMALPVPPRRRGAWEGGRERERSRALCTSHLGDEKNENGGGEGRGKKGKATEWCSFQNKFPRVGRGAEREGGREGGGHCQPTWSSLFSNYDEGPQFLNFLSLLSSNSNGDLHFQQTYERTSSDKAGQTNRAYFKLRI